MNSSQPLLICMMGLRRSGKSTWVRTQGLLVVNRDAIRAALQGEGFLASAKPWVILLNRTTVRALSLAGHSTIILDATNLTLERGSRWNSPNWQIVYKVMETPKEERSCRPVADHDATIQVVIHWMADEMQSLGAEEGAYEPLAGQST